MDQPFSEQLEDEKVVQSITVAYIATLAKTLATRRPLSYLTFA